MTEQIADKYMNNIIIKPINTVVVNDVLEYSSFVGGILTSQKIVDNIKDEKGAKKCLAKTLRFVFSKMERESMFGLPDLYDIVAEKLKKLKSDLAVLTDSIKATDAEYQKLKKQGLSRGGFQGNMALLAP